MNKKRYLSFFMMVFCWLIFQTVTAVAEEVVLWNKLGSDDEVTNSEIGPGGIFQYLGNPSGPYAYESAKFGNGFIRKSTDGAVKFPSSILDDLRQRGTAALWIVSKVPNPVPFQYGVFDFIGNIGCCPYLGGGIFLNWGDGVTGLGFYGGIHFDGANDLAMTPYEPHQFVATPGVPFHAALVWDIDGIEGTADTVRVYRDGAIVGRTSTKWNPAGGENGNNFYLGVGPDAKGFDKFISDNLVVYDYAKTDFSDRFIESPVGHSFAAFIPSLDVTFGPQETDDRFKLSSYVKLAESSNGIAPLTEVVTVQIGPFSKSIPAGSFQSDNDGFKYWNKKENFSILIKPPTTQVQSSSHVQPMEHQQHLGYYKIEVVAKAANLNGMVIPPKIRITLGDDSGAATLDIGKTKFDKSKDGVKSSGHRQEND
ncbi:hypothetical protein [Nitrosomonas sp.]|uniref:hypothetical protein n=1 Tax=Nitrosomonas sp. TaxID=42353 RepID=UPI0027320176|nr:hypothetical protein [Nitrosomonas sp.]MDP1787549.1 hypothetical protein [Nitrosomonas sp.]